MINYLWGFMILAGVVVGMATGRVGEVSTASINSSKEAVTLCITMLGVMSLWTGLMQVARAAGIIEALTKGMEPIITFLFPKIPREHKVREYITANMIANILGLGWAATPMGLKAMEELERLNCNSKRASTDMCTFLIINISSLQVVPISIIAYRSQYGSVNPARIVVPAIIATITSTIAGVAFSVIARKCAKDEEERK